MAVSPIVVTVCDCCLRRVEQPAHQATPPKGWRQVVATPMGGAVAADVGPGGPEQHWDLCTACYGEMQRLLQPKTRVSDLQEVPRAAD